jgi:hypothetical protein
MTITATGRGQGSNNTAGTSFGLAPTSDFAAGTAVLVLAYDNSGSGGSNPNPTATDSHGNSWITMVSGVFDPGAANAGIGIAILYSHMATGLLTTGSTITVAFSGNTTTAKAWAIAGVTTDVPGATLDANGSGLGTGANTASPTVTTTSSNAAGDLIVGGGAAEATNTWVGDGDTTNGSWSAAQTAGAGTGNSGAAAIAQYKVLTVGGATQTFDPTLSGGAADTRLAWIKIVEQLPAGDDAVDPFGMTGFFGV